MFMSKGRKSNGVCAAYARTDTGRLGVFSFNHPSPRKSLNRTFQCIAVLVSANACAVGDKRKLVR